MFDNVRNCISAVVLLASEHDVESEPDCLSRFERLPVEQVPPLWLIYSNSPSDSGAVHSPVKQRWLAGDTTIRRDMALLAGLAEQCRYALPACPPACLCLSLHPIWPSFCS